LPKGSADWAQAASLRQRGDARNNERVKNIFVYIIIFS